MPPGQVMRKQVPPERTRDVLEFSTKKPAERLNSIRNGFTVSGPTIFVHLPRHLNISTDPELESVTVRYAVWPQGGPERATTATPGSCITTPDPQVRSRFKATDNGKCESLLFNSQ